MGNLIDNLTASQEEDPNVVGEEYYELLAEINEKPANTSVSYKTIESVDKGKIKYAEEELELITGYPRNIMLTEKGYDQLLQYKITKNFQEQNDILDRSKELVEKQNEMLEESSELNKVMKEHTVSMNKLTKWILGFTVANLMLVIIQILLTAGVI